MQLSRGQWRRLLAELARRGRGERESGAFLLGHRDDPSRRVREWIPFDDLDADCLDGAISLKGEAFNELWRRCREQGLRVLADMHTHPGSAVRQSSIDRANPMVAQRGHVGVIVPNFAQNKPPPEAVGVHVYQGDRTWVSHFKGDAKAHIRLRRWRWWW